MSEQTQEASVVALPEQIESALKPLLDNPAYAAVVPMLTEKLSTHYSLVRVNNRNVSRINESRDTDPNNTEYQDLTWRRIAEEKSDAALVKLEAQFQKLEAAREKALAELRDMSKKHMQPALSEEEVQKLRKEVNDGKAVITASVTANASIADMADQMLTLAGKPVENGIWSLMPQPDSLMNARGRKSGTGNVERPEGNFTRLVEVFVDSKSANRTVKRKGVEVFAAHFNFVAEELSKEFGTSEFPGNAVTAEEVERAYYAANNVDWRNSDAMPADFTFNFTKEVETRNGADNTVKKVPVTKVMRVVRWTKETAGKEGELAKPEGESAKQDDNAEPANA